MRASHSGLIVGVSVLAGIVVLLVSVQSCRRTALPVAIAISFTNVTASISKQQPNIAPLWMCVATNSGRHHVAFWAESIEYKSAGEWMTNQVPPGLGSGFLFSAAVGPTSRCEQVFSLAPANTAACWRVRFRYQESGPLSDVISRMAGQSHGNLIIGARSKTVVSSEVVSP
jgi:hypothetical protein